MKQKGSPEKMKSSRCDHSRRQKCRNGLEEQKDHMIGVHRDTINLGHPDKLL